MISTDNNNQPQSQSKVRAFVRCRPPTLSEARSKPVVKLESDKISIGDKVFYFDESGFNDFGGKNSTTLIQKLLEKKKIFSII